MTMQLRRQKKLFWIFSPDNDIDKPTRIEGLFCSNPGRKDEKSTDKDAMWFFPKLGFSCCVGGEIEADLEKLKRNIPDIVAKYKSETHLEIKRLFKQIENIDRWASKAIS